MKIPGDNRGMKEESGFRVPDVTDYILSDSGAGCGYFFSSRDSPPEDSALRYYCHRACLLLSRDLEPEEVALSLGFPDFILFCRQFQEYTGVLPEEYRRWVQIRKSAHKS